MDGYTKKNTPQTNIKVKSKNEGNKMLFSWQRLDLAADGSQITLPNANNRARMPRYTAHSINLPTQTYGPIYLNPINGHVGNGAGYAVRKRH
jgi:hypothetical protein